MTNNHVVAGAAIVEVWLPVAEDPAPATVVARSECSDLAVIARDGDGYDRREIGFRQTRDRRLASGTQSRTGHGATRSALFGHSLVEARPHRRQATPRRMDRTRVRTGPDTSCRWKSPRSNVDGPRRLHNGTPMPPGRIYTEAPRPRNDLREPLQPVRDWPISPAARRLREPLDGLSVEPAPGDDYVNVLRRPFLAVLLRGDQSLTCSAHSALGRCFDQCSSRWRRAAGQPSLQRHHVALTQLPEPTCPL